MTEAEQPAIVEQGFTLLARSDQWNNFVGDAVKAREIDSWIYLGRLTPASICLREVTGRQLNPAQARYIIGARQEYLNTRDVDDPRPDSPLIEGCPTDEEIQFKQDWPDLYHDGWRLIEACPTIEEIQLMYDEEEEARLARGEWLQHEVHENRNRNDYPPYSNGRGYEGL